MAHRMQLRARFAELDPYNHVNHAVYVAWFEEGRVRALESLGAGLDALKEAGHQIVVTNIDVRYRRPVGPADVVDLITEIGEMGRASATWHQRVEVDGEVCVDARIRAGVTDATGRPSRPPAGFLEGLKSLMSAE